MRSNPTGKSRICVLLLAAATALWCCTAVRARVDIQPAAGRFVSWNGLTEKLRTNANAVTEVDAFGQTLLHAAARQGRADAVKLLLTHNADSAARDRWGWSPLAAAIHSGRVDTAKLLVAAGADLNARNNDGWTAVNVAALLGRSELVALLQEHNADLSLPNRWGATPLHSAAKNWHKRLFVSLWKNGADTDAADAAGTTPRQIVERRGFQWKKLFQEKTGVLPQTWVFRTDEDLVGEQEKWQLAEIPGAEWRPISTEKLWTHQEYPGIWHGTGWYRIDFTVAETGIDPGKLAEASSVLIAFGAIDGHAKVWLNGRLVGHHTRDLFAGYWKKPWSVDVTGVIKAEGVNRFAVACTKKVYAAGIHPGEDKLPVRLVLEQRTHRIQDTVELGVE